MQKAIFIAIVCILNISLSAQYKVQFIVEDLSIQKHDTIYIAGTFTEWGSRTPAYLLKPLNGTKKAITLDLPTGKHEYKFTRGDWLNVERDYQCDDIENRKINVHNDTVIHVAIPYWRDQCSNPDYLKKILNKQKSDTDKVRVLLMVGGALMDSFDFDNSIHYTNEAASLAEKINFGDGKQLAYSFLGGLYRRLYKFTEARSFFFKTIKILKEMGKEHLSGRAFLEISDSYWFEENYPEALNYTYIALRFLEEAGQKENMCGAFLRLGAYYETERNFSEALKNYFQALRFAEELGAESIGKAAAGESNRGLAEIYTKQGKFDEAIKRDSIALKIFSELGNPFRWDYFKTMVSIADTYKTQGDIAFSSGNKALAKAKFSEALKNYYSSSNRGWAVHSYTNIAKIKIKLHDLTTAREYMQGSLQVANRTKSKYDFEEAYSGWVALDSAEGNFAKAFEHYKLYILYRDSIYSKENTEKTTRIKMQYQFDKKQDSVKTEQARKEVIAASELKNQKLIRNFSLSGAIAILSFGGYSFYRYRRRRKLQSEQEMLNERLRISRELHDDMGSTLGSISIYSEVAKNRSAKNENADEVILKIGAASRELIDKMSDIVWSINPNNESLEQLQNRMQAFAAMILTPQHIQYSFLVDEVIKKLKLTAEERKNIFLIYKEAIHNIVKYADCKEVEIKLSLQDDHLEMIIKDDGKGFDVSKLYETDSLGGNGIKNMKARAESMHADFKINSEIDKGTSIELSVTLN